MSSMLQNLETIRTGIYGRDIRSAIYESVLELFSNQDMKTAIPRIISTLFPEFTISSITETAAGNSTLLLERPYYTIPNVDFDLNIDGIVIWRTRGSSSSVISSDFYTLDTQTENGSLIIRFSNSFTISANDIFQFCTYAKPRYVSSNDVRHIVSLTQTAYDALSTYDSSTLYCIIPEASS